MRVDRPNLRAGLLRSFHRDQDEARCVLDGRLGVAVGKDIVESRAGLTVFVPRGTPHTYWNPGPGLVRYLLVMTSNIHSLIQDIHAMADRSPAALRAVFEKHDSERIDQLAKLRSTDSPQAGCPHMVFVRPPKVRSLTNKFSG
jgi:uncharacterized cupin superfamily protein